MNSFNAKRAVIYSVAAILLLIAVLPQSSLAAALATMGVWAVLICGGLFALTFWPKARVRIGRLRLRYKLVRRNAGWVAVIGFSFLLMQAISLGVRSTAQPEGSSPVRNVPQPEGSSADSASNAAAIDPEQAVVRCFCDTLSAERKSQARENGGLATRDWPNPIEVDACVKRLSGVDEKQVDEAWMKQRKSAQGALQGDDGRVICQAAGMPLYNGEPPPVGPEIMQAAREEICRELTEPGDHDPGPYASNQALAEWAKRQETAHDAGFAARFHISIEQADAALKRASEEQASETFLCPGQEPTPTDAELHAPPTEAEIASARSAFCQAAREHPDKLIGELYPPTEEIYEASTSTRLARDRTPMVIDKAGEELENYGREHDVDLLHGEQVTQNYCK